MKALRPLFGPLFGIFLALGAGTGLLVILGERPGVLWEAFYNVCFTEFGLGYTLYYTTPYLFTGLSVAVCFRTGLFNIGAEGQLYIGAIAIVLVGSIFPTPSAWLGIPLGILASFLAGGCWGAIAGWLKAKRGCHEVIVTILLNFIGIALVNYLILYPLDNAESHSPETFIIPSGYFLPTFHELSGALGFPLFESTPANTSLFLAIGMAIFCQFFLFQTPAGFTLRAVGKNPVASRFAGISVEKQMWLALAFGGGLAGLVGVNEVMGYHHRVVEGFSPQYGFTGIAVALLARGNPLAIIASALLFGVLQNSARELEFLSEKITKELATVLQALLIALVAAQAVWEKLWRKLSWRAAHD